LVTGDDIMSLYEIEEHIGAMIAEEEFPTEALFNEQRALVDKWMQANSQKVTPPRAASGSNLREQSKSSPPKHRQQPEKHRKQPIQVNVDYKTPKMHWEQNNLFRTTALLI
jgi:hypothetical protein